MGRFVTFQSINDEDFLRFVWIFGPDFTRLYDSHLHYISHLLGAEHKGSLHEVLYQKNLILETTASVERIADLVSYVQLEFLLSEDAIDNIEPIFEAVGNFISKIKSQPSNVHSKVYNDLLKLNNIDFEYKFKFDEYDFITDITENLDFDHEIETILRSELSTSYNDRILEGLLKQMGIQNLMVFRSGKDLDLKSPDSVLNIDNTEEEYCVEKDQYFEVEFTNIKIPEKLKNGYLLQNNDNQFKSLFELPPSNKFIAQNFDLKPSKNEKQAYIEKSEDHYLSFWRVPEFKQPIASMYVDIVIDASLHYKSTKNYLYFKLWNEYIRSSLSSIVEEASKASVTLSLKTTEKSLRIKLQGLSDSMLKVADTYFEKLKKLAPFDNEDTYNSAFSVLEIEILKFFNQEPHEIGGSFLTKLTYSDHIDPSNQRKNLKNLNFNEFKNWVKNFYSEFFFEFYFTGNLSIEGDIQYYKTLIKQSFSNLHDYTALPLSRYLRQKQVIVKPNQNAVYFYKVEEETQVSSSINSQYHFDRETDSAEILANLTAQMIEEDFFSTLRTTEQLGYVCTVCFVDLNGHFAIEFEVQGSKHDANHFQQRITAFLKEEYLNLESNLTKERFQEVKEATLVNMNNKPLSIEEAGSLYFSRIHKKRRNMSLEELDVELHQKMSKISKSDFLNFFKMNLIEKPRRIDVFCIPSKNITKFKELLGKRVAPEDVFSSISEFQEGREIKDDKYHIDRIFKEN